MQLGDAQVYAYVRLYQGRQLLVLNNFYGTETTFEVPVAYQVAQAKTLISNYNRDLTNLPAQIKLQPYEAIALAF
ncbi:trehalose-6-phosphate hydrolase [Agrilactobacillus composti DSM 18527 = JCM 14202]|nr:trehalose-6-phosphate hydrolase [Agrilactobacillus composti DSM 18527 = JCM 14202]